MPEKKQEVTIEYQRDEAMMTPEGIIENYVVTRVSHPDYGIETITILKKDYSDERLRDEIRKWFKRVEEERAARRTIEI